MPHLASLIGYTKNPVMRLVIKLGIVTLIFAGLFWAVPITPAYHTIVLAEPVYLMAALWLSTVVIYLNALQMQQLGKWQGIFFGMAALLAVEWKVRFYSLFMPGMASSALRWHQMSNPTQKRTRALTIIVYYRFLEIFLSASLGAGFWMLSRSDRFESNTLGVLAIVLLITLAGLILTRLGQPLGVWLQARSKHLAGFAALHWVVVRLTRFLQQMALYAELPLSGLLSILGVGIGRHVLGAAWFFLLAQALGIHLGFVDSGWIRAVVTLASMLPISLGGGLGVREVTIVTLVSAQGVALDQALALSLLVLAVNLIHSVVGGIWEFSGAIAKGLSHG